jgi:hypothetical protein
MQRTADFHEQIADARLSQAAGVVDDAAALDTAVGMFDVDAAACDPSIGGVLRPREASAPWLLGRHDDLELVKGEAKKPRSCSNRLPAGKGYGVASAYVRTGYRRLGRQRARAPRPGLVSQNGETSPRTRFGTYCTTSGFGS